MAESIRSWAKAKAGVDMESVNISGTTVVVASFLLGGTVFFLIKKIRSASWDYASSDRKYGHDDVMMPDTRRRVGLRVLFRFWRRYGWTGFLPKFNAWKYEAVVDEEGRRGAY